ncbi:MAG: hypothetical protein ACI845_004140, partial [Gammaproteobacteria bacterium]
TIGFYNETGFTSAKIEGQSHTVTPAPSQNPQSSHSSNLDWQ